MYPLIDRFIEKLMRESTPDKPLWNIESIKSGKLPHWNYIDGCMMTSLLSLYKETKDQKYLDFVKHITIYLTRHIFLYSLFSLQRICALPCGYDVIGVA